MLNLKQLQNVLKFQFFCVSWLKKTEKLRYARKKRTGMTITVLKIKISSFRKSKCVACVFFEDMFFLHKFVKKLAKQRPFFHVSLQNFLFEMVRIEKKIFFLGKSNDTCFEVIFVEYFHKKSFF